MNQVKQCFAFPVGADAPADAYYVEAIFVDGTRAYHAGPRIVSFFTQEQAESLVSKVLLAGAINPDYWLNVHGYPLGMSDAEVEEDRSLELMDE